MSNPFKLLLLVFATILLGGAIGKAIVNISYHQPSADNAGSAQPDADEIVSRSSGGPPSQEVALDYYTTLTGWAKAYPQIRPAIIHALANDGKITYAEFDQINAQTQKFAEVEGRKAWDAEAKPYRQALTKAAQS